MGVAGMLCACVLAASPGEAGQAGEPNGAALPPRRDLFGTSERKAGKRPGSPRRVWGTVELSDDTKVEGWLSLAPGKPLEVFDLEAKEWREFTIDEIMGLRATPRKEERNHEQ